MTQHWRPLIQVYVQTICLQFKLSCAEACLLKAGIMSLLYQPPAGPEPTTTPSVNQRLVLACINSPVKLKLGLEKVLLFSFSNDIGR